MRVETSRHTVKHLATEARQSGKRESDFAGTGDCRCEDPRCLELTGRPDAVLVAHGIEPDRAVFQEAYVRCRKCAPCLKHRARLWTARAIDETSVSQRTWFGTLTLRPDRQTWARYTALSNLSRRVVEPTDARIFSESVAVIGEEITRFLKRVRKTTGFRYIVVSERHKSGLPHFHMLLHEYDAQIAKRLLEAQWRYGFSHWRLVNVDQPRQVGYVTKYLAKDALTRVRASFRYGQGHIAPLTERVLQATRAIGAVPPGQFRGSPPKVQINDLSVLKGQELQDE